MSRIHRPARIIPPAADPVDPPGTRRARRFDYAALLRRRAVPRVNGAASGDDGRDAYDAPDSGADEDAGGDAPGGTRAGASLAERIGAASAPVVDAVYRQQNRFIELTAHIAREIAEFCANRTIAQSGSWDVCLPLDPAVLPDTTLYLSLSPLCLQLRFDTQDPSSRQLLWQHSRLLDRELTGLLDAWGEPRQIEIVIG
ncbi:MAG: type III secretion system protein SctP [Burkholderia sp.]|jgi:type III secretion control protein HpaP|uniref:type III secretion system protein SctP n=2 Tax=Burkholderia sp. TaxID=36773 RepID=UPI00258EB512|nr:type III secretion system protein SctP [Burkholderia sp.]MCA3780498.1 type III secretion system protein SctP [Burkholderia sp.]MCA3787060.1 type III secretion system protein SctP [Burkholderia sp.]MCA3791075.1 type III secretion system protein SctP [Burkholderia sp.]MCA3801593.1 type III secretion system protein SctP [Burkholderia sp.]MCA3809589.1 type III secretion system protein SctP [Burkholderia sp.]